jgi:hypothetical protein
VNGKSCAKKSEFGFASEECLEFSFDRNDMRAAMCEPRNECSLNYDGKRGKASAIV